MTENICNIEILASGRYCKLTVCRDCKAVNIHLPGGMSFKLDYDQFFDILACLNRALTVLKKPDVVSVEAEDIKSKPLLH